MKKQKSKKIISEIKKTMNIQCSNGNWNYDPYMHGMANGLIAAYAIASNTNPKFLDAPSEWLCDKKVKPNSPIAQEKKKKKEKK